MSRENKIGSIVMDTKINNEISNNSYKLAIFDHFGGRSVETLII